MPWRHASGRAGGATARRRRPVRFRRRHGLCRPAQPNDGGDLRRRQLGAPIRTQESRALARLRVSARRGVPDGDRVAALGDGSRAGGVLLAPRACAGGHVGLTARGQGKARSPLSRGCSRSPTKRLPGQARPGSHPPAASCWPYDEIDPAPQPPGRRNFPGAAPSGARLPRETNFPDRAVLRVAPARVESDSGAGARRLAVTGRRRRGDRLPGTRTHKETTTWPASANS